MREYFINNCMQISKNRSMSIEKMFTTYWKNVQYVFWKKHFFIIYTQENIFLKMIMITKEKRRN